MKDNKAYKEKQRITALNTVLNILLASAKLSAGFIYKSAAVISDGVNSFTDGVTNIIILIGTRLASAPADKDHNYGHEKIESVISLVLGLAMLLVGGILLYGAAAALISGDLDTVFSPVLLVVSAVSVAVKEFMYRRTMRCAKKHNSVILKADAWNYRFDCISSLAVFAGVGLGMISPVLHFFEPVATIFVGILIVKVALEILLSSVNQLIDKAADAQTVERMTAAIMSVPGVKRIDSFKSRLSTYKIFVDTEISVDGNLSLHDAHDIAEQVHSLLEDEYSEFNIKHIHVHLNPF